MDDLLTDFIAETREMMEAIEGEIIAWEASPSDSSRLDAIFRFVHTVKGNCGFFDFPRLERLSHAAEDALSDVRAGHRVPDQKLVSAILAILDCIADMINAIEAGEDLPAGQEAPLIAALEENDTALLPEEAKVAVNPAAAAAVAAPRSIRLPVDLLDRVMSGVSDMVLARNDLAHRLQAAGTQPAIDGPFERLTTILNDVRDAITRMRMQRIEQLFVTIPRIVRDLSQSLGKQVMIDVEGGDVELDREVIEIIRDPITHIIRNAVDHGIETPSERRKAGKREIGLLRIAARQTGNRISIVISDDGRGLDEEKIAYKALACGLISLDRRKQMDSHAIQQLVFEAGLSTASEVSKISGRGVGMDVVRENLERVGGWIEVTSTRREGTSIHLHIPLTLSIIPGVTVEVGDQRYALPQSYVEEVEFGSDAELDFTQIGDAKLVTMRGKRTPCIALADVLEIESPTKPADQTFVLMRLAKGDHFALAVDRVDSIGDIVVKPLPPTVLEIGCYSGTALLDDGQPILLLDLPQIAEESGMVSSERRQISDEITEQSDPDIAQTQMAMVFIGLDGSRKAARLELVNRIETISTKEIDIAGTRPHAILGNEILPIAGLDDAPIGGGKIRFLRLSDGTNDLLYAVREVQDALPLEISAAPAGHNPMVEGISLVNGASVALLNGAALLNEFGTPAAKPQQVICSLPNSDWARKILAPLVASNGYAITYEQDDADVVISIENEPVPSNTEAADQQMPVIQLRVAQDGDDSENRAHNSTFSFEPGALTDALRSAHNVKKSAGGNS